MPFSDFLMHTDEEIELVYRRVLERDPEVTMPVVLASDEEEETSSTWAFLRVPSDLEE